MPATIEVSNAGPLRRARLEIGDLNILVGNNNTGKTFFATIAHRAMTARNEAYIRDRSLRKSVPSMIKSIVSSIITDEPSSGDSCNPWRTRLDAKTTRWVERLGIDMLTHYGRELRDSLAYAYGTTSEQLRRRTPTRYSANSYLCVSNTSPSWKVQVPLGSGEIEVDPPNVQEWLSRVFEPRRVHYHWDDLCNEIRRERQRNAHAITDIAELCEIILHLDGDLAAFDFWPIQCLHLPSERSGIMRSHRILASSAIQQASRAGTRPIAIRSLDGTAADFLSFIVALNPDRKLRPDEDSFETRAKDVEQALEAAIELEIQPAGPHVIVARTPEGRFELHRASSMISELAPLVLALRHHLGRYDYLTIDEPEAHLHPSMQISISKLLVELAKQDLGVLLTTHSDYFLEEIVNAIRMNDLSERGRAQDLPRIPAIGRQNVRALHFIRTDRGCVAESIIGDDVDPIDTRTFSSTNMRQYEESTPLINRLLDLRAGLPS